MIKYYCDRCLNQENKSDLYCVSLGTFTIYELCPDCFKDIKSIIRKDFEKYTREE